MICLVFLRGLVNFLSLFVFYFIWETYSIIEADVLSLLTSLVKDIHRNPDYREKPKTIVLMEILDELKEKPKPKNRRNAKSGLKTEIKNQKNCELLCNRLVWLHSKASNLNFKKRLSLKQSMSLEDSKSATSDYSLVDDIPKELYWVFDILIWPGAELARQMTILTYEIFSKIKPTEFINSSWTKPNKELNSPNILALIRRSNDLYFWIIEEVLRYDKKSVRHEVLEKFIVVALYLKELRNFNDLVLVVTALSSSIVKCLEGTLKLMGTVYKKHWIDLTTLCSYDSNYLRLRKAQNPSLDDSSSMEKEESILKIRDIDITRSSNLKGLTIGFKRNSFESMLIPGFESLEGEACPLIPYLGIILRDLSFTPESSLYAKDGHLINIDKIISQSQLIHHFLRTKVVPYNFQYNRNLSFLKKTCPLSEESLISMLEKLEPKFCLYKKKSIVKRPSATDLHYFILDPDFDFETTEYDSFKVYDKHFYPVHK